MSKQKDEMHIWAEKVVKGIDESAVFMQLYNPITTLAEAKNDPGYLLQLGYAVMADKPIAILAEYGDDIPEKLERIADVIQRFDRDSMQSIEDASTQAIKKLQSKKTNK